MRTRIVCLVLLAAGALAALSFLRGQERPPAPPPPAATPAPRDAAPTPAAPLKPVRDFSKLSDLQKQLLLSGQAGADWLFRMNTVKGRFVPGLRPALRAEMDGDAFLPQAGAAFALARAARVLGDERYAARAAQAVLVLLDATAADPKDAKVRYTTPPSSVVNRLGAAGLLVLAVHELPDPQADVLDKAEQFCNYIRRQARADGSLACYEGDDGKAPPPDDADSVNAYAGPALYALMRSQKLRPAAWKTDLVRKALAYYKPWWKEHKSLAFVPGQTAAYAEAYLLTKEQPFADFVFEMNDWACGQQYDLQLDVQKSAWSGGFKGWAGGQAAEAAPSAESACVAEGLADACRIAREAGDPDRWKRYTDGLQLGLQFLGRLQYAESNTAHFADWYKPWVLGGFHASAQDGDLRLDHTRHAVAALMHYLEHVAR
jgi:hypothetical protein